MVEPGLDLVARDAPAGAPAVRVLYDDRGPPLRLNGYASVWERVYPCAGRMERVAPGAFDIARRSVFGCFMHDETPRLAWTVDRSLRLFQDSHGLGFSMVVRNTWAGLALARGVARGDFRGCSFKNAHSVPGDTAFSIDEEDGREVVTFTRLVLEEITIAPGGANPHACCWLDTEDPADLPSYIAQARSHWMMGDMAATAPKRLAAAARKLPIPRAAAFQASAGAFAAAHPDMLRPRPTEPHMAAIEAILDQQRPGWRE